MTSERANAYRRVTKALADLGPSKLHANEQQVIREAADTLIFAHADDKSTRDALIEAHDLTLRLVEADRLLAETAERLLTDLADCGPETALPAAA